MSADEDFHDPVQCSSTEVSDEEGFRDTDHSVLNQGTIQNMLLVAARNGKIKDVQHMLDKMRRGVVNCDINCKGKNKSNQGWTAAHLAAYFGHVDVMSMLIECEADIISYPMFVYRVRVHTYPVPAISHEANGRMGYGWNRCGADINLQNDQGDTPLHRAAYTSREEMVLLLLQHDAKVNLINAEGNLAKQVARSENIKNLIKAAESFEARQTEEDFLRATRENDVETLETLLKKRKPSISCTDQFGNSALHTSAYMGHREAAVLLIQHGIDSSLRNAKGQTAEEMTSDPQMKKLLGVSPVKTVSKHIQRFEGPLLKRSRVLGWKPVWVVLEKGVLSIFRNRADASTGVKRRGFHYLDRAKVKAPKETIHIIQLHLADGSTVTLSVEMDTSVHINRQKWLTSIQEHIEYCRQWSQGGATVSDDENDEREIMPLGSIRDTLQTAQAHKQVLEQHVDTVTSRINDLVSDNNRRSSSLVELSQLVGELQHVVECSRDMWTSMNHALTILSQQDKVRQVEVHQEREKVRVLQDALSVLAEQHHHLEQSVQAHISPSQSPANSQPASPRDSMLDSGDEDEFHDCSESNLEETSMASDRSLANGVSNHVMCSKWGTRNQLPAPMLSRSDFSVWSILKQCIGKELSKITMPVIFNEPLSFVQRVVEYMEYSELLKLAVDCDDHIKRLEYVTAFAVSATASNWERLGKPFNPLLGETYELNREDLGFKVVCEQVSHHPPVSAFHTTSPLFSFHGAIHPKLKFWGKSIEVTPRGQVTLTLHKHNEVYTWQNVNCCVHNIIVGKIWVEHFGSMEVTNMSTQHKSVLHFKPCGWFSKEIHKVEGYLMDNSKRKIKSFYGKWIEAFYSCDTQVWDAHNSNKNGHKGNKSTDSLSALEHATPGKEDDSDDPPPSPIKGSSVDLQLPGQTLLWQATPKPANSNKYYSFTEFAMMLNELTAADKSAWPPTDSRLRPDMRKMEEGDMDGASAEKNRVEEKQRAARKERKKRKEEWKPRWFKLGINPHTGKEDWLYQGEYWDRSWDRCPDIF